MELLLIIGVINLSLVVMIVMLVLRHYSKREIQEMTVDDQADYCDDSFTHEGKTYPMRIRDPFPQGKSRAPSGYLELGFMIPEKEANQFAVILESGLDRFAKRIGISEELEVGNEEFDRRFYLISPITEDFRNYFSNAEHQRVLTGLFDQGIEVVGCDGRIFGMVSKSRDREGMKKHIPELLELLKGVPRDPTQVYRSSFKFRFFHQRATGSLLLLSLFLSTSINALWWLPNNPFDILPGSVGRFFLAGLGLGLLATVPVLFWREKVLKHTAFAHYSLIRWAGGCFAILPLVATILLGTVNRVLDPGAPRIRPAYVMGAAPRGGKRPPSMDVLWHDGSSVSTFRMTVFLGTNREYQAAESLIGRQIGLQVKSGYLGFPWLKEYSLVPLPEQ